MKDCGCGLSSILEAFWFHQFGQNDGVGAAKDEAGLRNHKFSEMIEKFVMI